MPLHLSRQIEAFEPVRIKSGKQHLINDKQVYLRRVLETVGNPFAVFGFSLVMQNQFGTKRMFLRGLVGIEALFEKACLFVLLQDHHTGYRVIGFLYTETLEVTADKLDEGLKIFRRVDNHAFGDILLLHLHIIGELLFDNPQEFVLVVGLNVLAHQTQRETVCNRFVVVVFVVIMSEDFPCLAFLFEQRRSCQRDTHRLGIGVNQVSEEHAARSIATVRFVHKENTLDIGAILKFYFLFLLIELMDIDHHYFRFSLVVLHCAVVCKVFHQFLSILSSEHFEPTSGELTHRLFHQREAVHYEIEPRYGISFCKIIREDFDCEICESGFSASLRVPDGSGVDASIQRSTDSTVGVELRIAHDMFLQLRVFRAVLIFLVGSHIRKAVFQQIQDTVFGKQR